MEDSVKRPMPEQSPARTMPLSGSLRLPVVNGSAVYECRVNIEAITYMDPIIGPGDRRGPNWYRTRLYFVNGQSLIIDASLDRIEQAIWGRGANVKEEAATTAPGEGTVRNSAR